MIRAQLPSNEYALHSTRAQGLCEPIHWGLHQALVSDDLFIVHSITGPAVGEFSTQEEQVPLANTLLFA